MTNEGEGFTFASMKRFLVPVDFSVDATAAFNYSIALAQGLNVHLFVLLHVQKPGTSETEVKDQSNALQQLASEAEKALGDGVTVMTKILSGQPEEVIERLAHQLEADLIIMGTAGQGDEGGDGNYLGAVSGSMFKHTELPMLFVPGNIAFQKPEKMAFIMKSLMVYKPGVLQPMLEIAKAYSSELAIVQIKASALEENYGKESNLDLEGTDHNVYQLSCATVPEGISKVINTFSPQILCVIRRKRDFFESLFKARSVAASDFYSSVPVLVLQGAR